MSPMNRIFPANANNDYRGSPIAFYGLCLFAAMFTFRSLVHYFKEDGGANSIASIITFPGSPDPDHIIYLVFSLWGSQQIVTLCILLLVLVRYRTLIPFMLLMLVLEQVLRIGAGVLHPLTPEYYERTPPGVRANLPLLLIAMTLLALSLRDLGRVTVGRGSAKASTSADTR